MTKRMIEEVDGSSSKVQELETWSRIVAACKPGSYLNSFFTPALSARVHWTIVNDWNTDIYGEQESDLNTLTQTVVDLKRQVKEQAEEIARYEAEVNRLTDTNTALVARSIDLHDTLYKIRSLASK